MQARNLLGGLLLAGVAAVACRPAFANDAFAQSFLPTEHDLRPWMANRTESPWGMGEVVGRAALTGKGRLLVVLPKLTAQTFIVGHTRFFDASGKPLPRGSVRDGDRVKVDFTLRGNTAIADRVKILSQARR